MSIKLTYFDGRGRAEYTRMTLEAAGKKYEDNRISFEEWPKLKPTTPYGSLPVLVYNGKTFGQSGPIGMFLAKECGLYGKNNQDGLRIEEVHGLWEDQLQAMAKSRFCKDEKEKAELTKKYLEEDVPKFCGHYERFLKENGSSGYLVGKALTIGDFMIYDMGVSLLDLNKDVLKPFPLMQKQRQLVEANPKIKAYLAKRKQTPF